MKPVIHLSLEAVIAIHDSMIDEYGGSHGIRDLGLIQSAVARPQSTFSGEDLYTTLFEKGAALFHSLLFNHGFIDGNKRTSFSCLVRFLYVNGYELSGTDAEFIEFPLQVEREHLDIEKIAGWISGHISELVKRVKG